MSAPASALQGQLASTAAEPRTTPRRPGADAQHLAWQREMERAESEAWFKTRAPDDKPAALIAPALVPRPPAAPLVPARVAQEPLTEPTVLAAPAADSAPDAARNAPRGDGKADRAGPPSFASDGGTRSEAPTNRIADAQRRTDRMAHAPLEAVAGPYTALAPRGAGSGPIALPGPLAEVRNSTPNATAARATPVPVAATSASPAAAPPPLPAATTGIAPTRSPAHSERVSAAIVRALEPTPPVRLHVENRADGATVWIGLDANAAALELPQLVDALSRWLSRIGMRLRSVVCNGATCYERRDAAGAVSSSTDIDVVVERET